MPKSLKIVVVCFYILAAMAFVNGFFFLSGGFMFKRPRGFHHGSVNSHIDLRVI